MKGKREKCLIQHPIKKNEKQKKVTSPFPHLNLSNDGNICSKMVFVDIMQVCSNLTGETSARHKKPQITNLACDSDRCKSCLKNASTGFGSDDAKKLDLMRVTGTTLTTHSQTKQSPTCHSHVDTQPGLEFQTKPENYSKHHMLQISRAVLLNGRTVGPNVQYLHRYLLCFPAHRAQSPLQQSGTRGPAAILGFLDK